VAKKCSDLGIKNLTVYALSTENKKRKTTELKGILSLLQRGIEENTDQFLREGFRLKIIGNKDSLSSIIRRVIERAEQKTAKCDQGSINVAFNYGGREEIINTISKLLTDGEAVNEKSINDNLYTAGLPDPDLIIRSGGQHRLSNFLIWQSAYSELYFTDCLWPEFGEEELVRALEFYSNTQRNFGK
jgi:undecaprenyl diphosphate synthase